MAINLSKGQTVDLSKEDPGLDEVMIGLGWDVRQTDGKDFDLDASCFLLGASGKVRAAGSGLTEDITDFCFYRNKSLIGGAVEHQGDNLTGAGDGDDEQIKVKLSRLPADIEKIAVVVTIHQAEERRQSFGQVSNAFIRLVNNLTGVEVAKFDLSEDSSTETAITIGEVYRHGGSWKFRAVGQGYQGGLASVCRQYGIDA